MRYFLPMTLTRSMDVLSRRSRMTCEHFRKAVRDSFCPVNEYQTTLSPDAAEGARVTRLNSAGREALSNDTAVKPPLTLENIQTASKGLCQAIIQPER